MTEKQDAVEALLAQYVAGILPEPARVLVAAHLGMKSRNQSLVEGLERAAGLELGKLDGVALSRHDDRLDRVLASSGDDAGGPVHANASGLPPVLRDFIGYGVEDIPWRTKLPGFREFDLGTTDGCHVSLFWLRPGRKIPNHTHTGLELTLVLDGAFFDSTGHYCRGDIAIGDEALDHQPIATSDRPCIGMAVTEAPLRLTGPLHRRFADMLGL